MDLRPLRQTAKMLGVSTQPVRDWLRLNLDRFAAESKALDERALDTLMARLDEWTGTKIQPDQTESNHIKLFTAKSKVGMEPPKANNHGKP